MVVYAVKVCVVPDTYCILIEQEAHCLRVHIVILYE